MAAKLLTDDLYDEGNRHIVATLFKKHPDNIIFRTLYLIFARELSDLATVDKHMAPILTAVAKGNLDYVDDRTIPSSICTGAATKRSTSLRYTTRCHYPPDTPRRAARLPHTWGDKIRIGYLLVGLLAGPLRQ